MKLTTEKDTITPFIDSLVFRTKDNYLKAFASTLAKDLKDNVDESFVRQVYFSYPITQKWRDLEPSTVSKRKKNKTWYGMNGSILKEKYQLWQECKRNVDVRKKAGNVLVRLWTKDKIAIEHQTGREKPTVMPARPVYSLSKETIDKVSLKVFKYLTW